MMEPIKVCVNFWWGLEFHAINNIIDKFSIVPKVQVRNQMPEKLPILDVI